MERRTVESTRHISINDVKKHLSSGNSYIFSWHDKESVVVDMKLDHIILAYKRGKESVRTTVNIKSTKVGYGVRLWFSCPACGKNTARLYNVRGVFACRECHNLTYVTCKRSGNKLSYLAWQIYNLQLELGLSGDDIDELPYFKPKYMHWKTFLRKRQRLETMQFERDREWLRLCKFYARI